MSQKEDERTCTRCGAAVAWDAVRCPVCGSDPTVGPLVVRRSNPPALPWRQIARPLAAGATLMAAGAAIRLARRLIPHVRLRRDKPQPPAVVEEEAPPSGRIVAIRRRVWAVGDRSGVRRWGADETVWRQPGDS